MDDSTLSPQSKALRINLDSTFYGTFAEIGAGQEVARWFFHVGGAAGTVAKTISAYDMSISDAIYGKSDRYVSRQRLEAMLAYEFDLMVERLASARAESTAFFAFANTVATRSYKRRDDGQGWLGVRFQSHPKSPASEVIVHVYTLDKERAREQEALGILGVNLLFGALYLAQQPDALIASLLDTLTRDRVEIDMIKLSGPAFGGVDNRLMSLQLVQHGFTDAAMFTASGEVVQPSEVLYKKPILVERGRFRPVTRTTLEVLDRATVQFLEHPDVQGEEPVILMEMTLQDLASGDRIDHRDYLARVDLLHALGKAVLISNHGPYHELAESLTRHTQKPIGIALGATNFAELARERQFQDLPGGLLEATGRLFKHNVRVYVYPALDRTTHQLIDPHTVEIPLPGKHLWTYLRESDFVEPIRNYTAEYLAIDPDDVLARIQSGDTTWEQMVPPAIVDTIKQDQLFGWHPPTGDRTSGSRSS